MFFVAGFPFGFPLKPPKNGYPIKGKTDAPIPAKPAGPGGYAGAKVQGGAGAILFRTPDKFA